MLLAIEQDEAAAAAAGAAASLAKAFSRPLLALHVRTEAEKAAGLNPCAVMEDQRSQFGPAMDVRCLVKDGDPAVAVAEAIEENQPCILVTGVKRASGTPGPHGTAFALLSASRVPVLCVPPAAEGRDEAPEALLAAAAQ